MKKALIISAILVLAFSSMMFATETRILSLGLQNVPWMTQDVTLVNLYPAQLVNYGNLADLEYAGPGAIGGGATFNLGGNVLGLAYVPYNGNLGTLIGLVGGNHYLGLAAYPIHQTAVGYGMNMGGMTGGIGIAYGSQAQNLQVGPITGSPAKTLTDNSLQNLDILLGIGIPSDSPLDIGVNIGLPGANWSNKVVNAAGTTTVNDTDSAGGVELGVNGRLGLGSLLTNLAINFTDLSDTMNTPETFTKQSTSLNSFGIGLGAAQTVKPSENTDVIIGGLLNLVTYNTDNKTTVNGALQAGEAKDAGTLFKIPVYIAAEAKLNSTFTLRGGLGSPIYAVGSEEDKTLNAAGNTTVDDTNGDVGNGTGIAGILSAADDPTLAVGIGAKIGDVSIDADIADAFLLNGPFFFTGDATAGFAGQVAISYVWK